MNKRNKTRNFAKQLGMQLKAQGFTVQWYQSTTSNSIYLKLDYGVAHSVRISDHKGKKGFKYRYNLLSNVTYKKVYRVDAKQAGWRYFAPYSCVDDIVEIIVNERDSKIRFWGQKKYDEMMTISYVQNNGKPGFWSKYKYV